MIEPKHKVRPAFEQARDKIAFLENRLSDEQKARYDEFVKKQDKEKEEQKRKAARAKAEYDQAKEKAPHLVKNYDPPTRIKDPYLRRMALDAQREHQKVTTLERTQIEDKVRLLEKMDQEREREARQASPGYHQDFARAVATGKPSHDFKKAGRYDPASEAPLPQYSAALERAFEKARAQQEQTRHRTQSHEHGRNRERGRD